ncbi:MAG: hypothetical protein Q8S31_08350 [Alphaproteobacteria bacterium]|nr:hypothetical protein [Alphaproteobacteria bacterium]
MRITKLILLLLFIFLVFSSMHLKQLGFHEAMNHMLLTSVTVIGWVFYIAYGFYLYKKQKENPDIHPADAERLKAYANRSFFHVFLIEGTVLSVIIGIGIVAYHYLTQHIGDFPYHILWWALIGYPLAFFSWVITKKRCEKS